jgi:methionine-rich copper-binding protein CopC
LRLLRCAVVVGAALLAGSAQAHSLLLESTPPAGAVLSAPPSRITLRFNNRIEKGLSRLILVRVGGEARALDLRPAGGPDRLEATPPSALAAGDYRLEWHVLSTDGHLVSGAIPFRVAP